MTRKVAKFGSSRPLSRSEDSRLLSGNGTFIDNSAPPGALCAYFFRSPVAHASFSTLDVADAKKAPGVHLVLVAADGQGSREV